MGTTIATIAGASRGLAPNLAEDGVDVIGTFRGARDAADEVVDAVAARTAYRDAPARRLRTVDVREVRLAGPTVLSDAATWATARDRRDTPLAELDTDLLDRPFAVNAKE